jgi:hypothetical protein
VSAILFFLPSKWFLAISKRKGDMEATRNTYTFVFGNFYQCVTRGSAERAYITLGVGIAQQQLCACPWFSPLQEEKKGISEHRGSPV